MPKHSARETAVKAINDLLLRRGYFPSEANAKAVVWTHGVQPQRPRVLVRDSGEVFTQVLPAMEHQRRAATLNDVLLVLDTRLMLGGIPIGKEGQGRG